MADYLKFLKSLRREALPGIDMREIWEGMSYIENENKPIVIKRALALKNILDNGAILIMPDELIVGSLSGLFTNKLPDNISKKDAIRYRKKSRETGRRDFLSNFDHCAVDYQNIVKEGLAGFSRRVEKRLGEVKTRKQKDFLLAVGITLSAARQFILRYANTCEKEAKISKKSRAAELIEIAKICRNIANKPPENFHEAIQLVWFIHLIFAVETRGAMALGRFDQYIFRFYENDIRNNRLNRRKALYLISHLWAKFEEPGIINPIQNICIGGVKENGEDAANELSYICLEATELVGTPKSNLSARLHDKTPEKFFEACAKVIRTGIGFPAVFNDEILIPALVKKGFSRKAARNYCLVGCIETFLQGKQPPWSDSRFNMLECVNLVLRNGADEFTGKQKGPRTGKPEKLKTYREFESAFVKQVESGVKRHVDGINAYKKKFSNEKYMDPFISAFTNDCIKRAKDINDGGARYPGFHGIACMGLGTTSDALAAIKKLVYEQKHITLKELIKALDVNFKGYEIMRQELLNHAPKYGNGEHYVDSIAKRVAEISCRAIHGYRTPDRGWYLPLMAANIQNISAGKEVGATPDGRFSRTPLSDAASPHFGRDWKGPTAIIESIANVDYTLVTGGTVVNMKFNPSVLKGDTGLMRLVTLLKVFVKKRLQEFQFNVTGTVVMKNAQKNPQQYRNLLVRVSGFSAFFIELSKEVQDDIIRRTEQGSVNF